VNGFCHCPAGYTGSKCNERCPDGHYGTNCSMNCSCPENEYCDHVTGECSLNEVKERTFKDLSETSITTEHGSTNNNNIISITGILLVLFIVLIATITYIIYLKYYKGSKFKKRSIHKITETYQFILASNSNFIARIELPASGDHELHLRAAFSGLSDQYRIYDRPCELNSL
jgi:hypothetical protein